MLLGQRLQVGLLVRGKRLSSRPRPRRKHRIELVQFLLQLAKMLLQGQRMHRALAELFGLRVRLPFRGVRLAQHYSRQSREPIKFMDGKLTAAEFREAAEGLLAAVQEYNGKAAAEEDVIDATLHHISAGTAYLTTAPVYLELFRAVQIFYSPPFQTPVAYFALERMHDAPTAAGFGAARLSCTEHPVTGLPCCYLHPCQTASIMGELGCHGPTDYLLKWLGIYGNDLPVRPPHRLFINTTKDPCIMTPGSDSGKTRQRPSPRAD